MDVLAKEFKLIEKNVAKLENILDDQMKESRFTLEEFMMVYTTIYNICCAKAPQGANTHYWQELMYEKYRQMIETHITSKVLPHLHGKRGKFMLREMAKRWSLFKVFVHWLSTFFSSLDRFYTDKDIDNPKDEENPILALRPLGFSCFKRLVYQQYSNTVRDAVIFFINKERDGAKIDRALLKSVVDMFVEVALGEIGLYEKDFEAFLLADSVFCYWQKASEWIQQDSCQVYMVKTEKCLLGEQERVRNYLQPSSKEKLLKIVKHELLSIPQSQLLEDVNCGFYALLRDGKVYDLARMFWLFSRVEGGLKPVLQMFQKYVNDEVKALVKKGKERKDVSVKKATELHYKHFTYVTCCFHNHPLFRSAVEEAYQVFCDNLLKNGRVLNSLAVIKQW